MLRRIILVGVLVGSITPGFADDVSNRVGITGLAQAGWPLGQQSVIDQAKSMGPIFGGMISYGLNSHWGLGASYNNYDLGNGLRVEPVILQLLYHVCPESRWTPTLLAGGGISRGIDARNFHHAAAKAGVGLDYFLTPDFTLGPQVNFYYVGNTDDSPRHLIALGAGLAASYYFGGQPAEKPAPQAAAPAPITLALAPASATLGPNQTQQLNAQVSGTSNQGVSWSLDPALGSVSSSGLYTAPATIALPQKVTVTATSLADGSKSARSVIQLNPPANAPQQVSITINVLFDTGKAIVKPEYRTEIQKVADFMKSYPSAKAEIEGHTDNVGDASYNLGLSQRRADAVRNELTQQFGVSTDRLTAKGYGDTKPVADNKTKEGRKQNRRVVATLSATK